MKTAIFAATALSVLINTGAAIADPAKRTKEKTAPAPMMQVMTPATADVTCANKGWVKRDLAVNWIVGECTPGSFTTEQPFDN